MTARLGITTTVLGGSGAWPGPGGGCSGYLIEHAGFHLLLDPGYATFPRLIEHIRAGEVDAVYVSHGHPDHCVDLNPLLRARALAEQPAVALPVYAPPGELGAEYRPVHGRNLASSARKNQRRRAATDVERNVRRLHW